MAGLPELKEVLAAMHARENGLVVAFSGGVDSTLLARVARETLPAGRLLAVTAQSPVRPRFETEWAVQTAAALDLPHILIETDELSLPEFVANSPERCYHCKKGLYRRLLALAAERGLGLVADGTNVDETRAYRPGLRAAAECGIRSPLAQAGLDKKSIRALSRALGLANWDRPAYSCLATRFPYGRRLTPEGLRRVEEGEGFLHSLGLRQVRLRDHGEIARLEVDPVELERAFAARSSIVPALKGAGYLYVALDLEGYQSGSMDRVLPDQRDAR
ncbi:MAG: ATP-dependent sacrificial sulfur transferase LarE [Patescibacteria group bacterium]